MLTTLALSLAAAAIGPPQASDATVAAARPQRVQLWPGRPPGETGELPPERDFTKPEDKLIAGRRIIKLGNVSVPDLAIYRPPAGQDTGAAVIICPGGGHHILAYDLEGTEVAEWLNGIGVTGIVLKYRVPARPGEHRWRAAVQDAQRAVSFVRSRAASTGIDPGRIGVLGFSAGGETAGLAALFGEERTYPAADDVDAASCRPDFALLIYPGGFVPRDGDELRPHVREVIGTGCPPVFFAHAFDDPVTPLNSLHLFTALKKAGVPAELHVYAAGGHGYGLRRTEAPVTAWPDRAADWLRATGVLGEGADKLRVSPRAPGAELVKLAGGFKFTEGPTADATGNVYFTDQPNDRILRWGTGGDLSTFLSPAGRANGLYIDGRGQLWACADGRNELWRIDLESGAHEVVARGPGGKLFNGPNDVWVHPDGGVYFTDPLYRRPYWEHRDPEGQLPRGVYHLAPGGELRRVDEDYRQPNGIVGTPDGRRLFVADIGLGRTYVYDIGAGGELANRRLFCSLGSDGMTLDEAGNLYLTGRGVTIFDPAGKQLDHIDVPAGWTANVCFGGADRSTLFVTAGESLFALRMRVRGAR